MRPIAITIGSSEEGHILARADRETQRKGQVQLYDFVRSGDTIGRIIRIADDHDFPRDQEVSLRAKRYLLGQSPDPKTLEMLYQRLVIEPLGTVYNGEIAEYTGGIGYFQPIYPANPKAIGKLYPHSDGLQIGEVPGGSRTLSGTTWCTSGPHASPGVQYRSRTGEGMRTCTH